MTLTFGKKRLPEGLKVCINYEFNLLDHVGVVQKGGGVRQAFMTGRTDNRTDAQPCKHLKIFKSGKKLSRQLRTTREHNAFAFNL